MPPTPSGERISYVPSFVPEARAIRARNYSLGSTFAADATILDVSPDSEATAQNLPHLLHQMLSPDF